MGRQPEQVVGSGWEGSQDVRVEEVRWIGVRDHKGLVQKPMSLNVNE